MTSLKVGKIPYPAGDHAKQSMVDCIMKFICSMSFSLCADADYNQINENNYPTTSTFTREKELPSYSLTTRSKTIPSWST